MARDEHWPAREKMGPRREQRGAKVRVMDLNLDRRVKFGAVQRDAEALFIEDRVAVARMELVVFHPHVWS